MYSEFIRKINIQYIKCFIRILILIENFICKLMLMNKKYKIAIESVCKYTVVYEKFNVFTNERGKKFSKKQKNNYTTDIKNAGKYDDSININQGG